MRCLHSKEPLYHRPAISLAFRVFATTLIFAPSIGATSFAAPVIHAEVPASESHSPTFRFTEVQKHVPYASKKWVTRCSGNRRSHMISEARSTDGIQWQLGAISNSEWAGMRLRDVLEDAGFAVNNMPDDIINAQFMGAESYGASIPVDKSRGQTW